MDTVLRSAAQDPCRQGGPSQGGLSGRAAGRARPRAVQPPWAHGREGQRRVPRDDQKALPYADRRGIPGRDPGMAKVSVLVDTDVFIDYFNSGRFSSLFDSSRFTVYYSVVTKKELLSKPGLREAERQAILHELSQCRIVKLTEAITTLYSELRERHPSLDKED